MSTENPFVPEPTLTPASSVGTTLRWWPAAGLLAVMAGMKLIMLVLETPPLPVIMITFMGPAAVSVVILFWWLFASRASLKEKLIGLGGTVCAAVVASLLLHFSMKGMSFALYVMPTGFALFALSLVLLANRPTLRLPVALIAATLGFGIWELVQLHGVTGKFSPEFSWRWSPTPEQEYVKSLAEQKSDTATAPVTPGENITRASAQWSDFRGPQRDGNLPGVTLDEDWNAAPPKLTWKTKIGPGWSSFTVAGNRLFTQEQRGDNEAKRQDTLGA
jgi:outer membrane protein assembly factor BamB